MTDELISGMASASTELVQTVKKVSDTDLNFSVENELNKMVVVVRAVGSDEIIRQFPPGNLSPLLSLSLSRVLTISVMRC